ncbi:MAG: hypothetical protein H6Q41_2663 [Deltaproteobacteria bacterium]|jgi:hypothetical protein|nr:hypothetical protein [Deltaproteobacteria bacterium]
MRFLKKSLITQIKEEDYTDQEIGVIFLGISEIMCKIDLT